MTLHIAQINLPVTDNDGRSLQAVHEWLAGRLADVFGGLTAYPANGMWRSPATGVLHVEPVMCYVVAMEDVAINRDVLTNIAYTVGREARQEAVYVQLPDGTVNILDTQPQTIEA